MKIPHLQCCFSNKTSKRIKFHSPSLLISDRLKSSQQKRIWIRCYIFMSWKNTLNITEPSNLRRYSHDYNHLTKPRIKDKHHWYWNPYDFCWVMSLATSGVTNPRGNHHHRWSNSTRATSSRWLSWPPPRCQTCLEADGMGSNHTSLKMYENTYEIKTQHIYEVRNIYMF